MDAGTTILVFLLIVAGLATLIRYVSLAIRKAKKEQIRYEKKNPTNYL